MEVITNLLNGNNLWIAIVVLIFMFLRGSDTANPAFEFLFRIIRSAFNVPDKAADQLDDGDLLADIAMELIDDAPENQPVRDIIKRIIQKRLAK